MKEFIKIIVYHLLSSVLIKKGKGNFIYITFDDGPHPENTYKILSILNQYNVKATFFMTGFEMQKYPEIVRDVINANHTVAYHGYKHESMKKQNIKTFIADIKNGRNLEKIFNIQLKLYRPPFGDISVLGFIYLVLTGWKIIMWSLDSRDSYDSKDVVLQTISPEKISPGEILLFHDDYIKTADLLGDALQHYKDSGINIGKVL